MERLQTAIKLQNEAIAIKRRAKKIGDEALALSKLQVGKKLELAEEIAKLSSDAGDKSDQAFGLVLVHLMEQAQ